VPIESDTGQHPVMSVVHQHPVMSVTHQHPVMSVCLVVVYTVNLLHPRAPTDAPPDSTQFPVPDLIVSSLLRCPSSLRRPSSHESFFPRMMEGGGGRRRLEQLGDVAGRVQVVDQRRGRSARRHDASRRRHSRSPRGQGRLHTLMSRTIVVVDMRQLEVRGRGERNTRAGVA